MLVWLDQPCLQVVGDLDRVLSQPPLTVDEGRDEGEVCLIRHHDPYAMVQLPFDGPGTMDVLGAGPVAALPRRCG